MAEVHHFADMADDHAPGSAGVLDCNGVETWRTYGTWKGHVGPGAIFLAWGAWWTLWVFFAAARQCSWSSVSSHDSCGELDAQQGRGSRHRQQGFRAQPWYGPSIPYLRYLEPILKTAGPLIMVFIELYGDHSEFRTLTCADGRFALMHVNNWQHATVYPGFLLSALLDWLALFLPLPAGLQQVALSAAFGIEGFLMANHKKHEALDQAAHLMLVLAIWGCAVAPVLELRWPHLVLVASGRGFFAMLQGAWFFQIARMMWGGDPRWDIAYPGGAVMAPVYFVWVVLTVATAMISCYCFMTVAVQRLMLDRSYFLLPLTQRDIDPADAASKQGQDMRTSRRKLGSCDSPAAVELAGVAAERLNSLGAHEGRPSISHVRV